MASRKSSNKHNINSNKKTLHNKRKQAKNTISNNKQPRRALTQEQKAAARARNNISKRLRRASLSLEDLQKLREKEALQKRTYRQNSQTEEQKAAAQARNSRSKRMRRAALSTEELLQLRQKEALNKKRLRESMTQEQLDEIRSRDLERKRSERSRIGVRKTNESYIAKRKTKRKPAAVAAAALENGANKTSAKKGHKKVKFS